MILLAERKRWLRKPPVGGAEVNWAHPLATNLVGCWLFHENAGSSVYDLVRPAADGTLTNTPTWRDAGVDRLDSEVLFAAASDEYINVGDPAKLQITGPMAIAVSYRLTTTPGSDFQLVTKDKDSGGRAYTMDVQAAAGLRFYINGGSVGTDNLAAENVAPAVGVDKTALGVYTGAASAGLRVYMDGVRKTDSGTTDTSIPTATANVLFGRREYAGFEHPLDGAIRYVMIWTAAKDDAEAQELYEAPFCMLQERVVRRVFIMPAAAAGNAARAMYHYRTRRVA